MLTGGEDETARLWDVATGKQIRAWGKHEDGVKGNAYWASNSDGKDDMDSNGARYAACLDYQRRIAGVREEINDRRQRSIRRPSLEANKGQGLRDLVRTAAACRVRIKAIRECRANSPPLDPQGETVISRLRRSRRDGKRP